MLPMQHMFIENIANQFRKLAVYEKYRSLEYKDNLRKFRLDKAKFVDTFFYFCGHFDLVRPGS